MEVRLQRIRKIMKMDYMDMWLSSNRPTRIMLDIFEWVIIVGIGLLFPYPQIPSLFISKILGIIFITIGFCIRRAARLANEQYRQPKEKIEKLATTGIYSKIRHPCYIGFICYYLGALFMLGSFSILIPIFLFTYCFYDSAIKEEKFLTEKFGEKYRDYLEKVPWKFIPKIF